MDPQAVILKKMEKIESTFSERMRKYEEDLKAASKQATPDIAGLSRDYSDFKSFVLDCLGLLKNQMEHVMRGLDKHEMGTRRKVLLFHGVPEQANEEPGDVIRSILCDSLKVPAECSKDVRVAHRLGAKGDDKVRPMLVRFVTHNARRDVWDVKKNLKGTGITVSEFLTKPRHDLFVAARKHFGMSNVWSTDGKVVLLLPNKRRAKLECMADLLPYSSKFPSKEAPSPADKLKQPAAGTTTGGARSVRNSVAAKRLAAGQSAAKK